MSDVLRNTYLSISCFLISIQSTGNDILTACKENHVILYRPKKFLTQSVIFMFSKTDVPKKPLHVPVRQANGRIHSGLARL